MSNEPDDKKQNGAITALTNLLMFYLNKGYEITGLLSPSASFTLKIEGEFGKKELEFLIKRLRADAKMLGDAKLNETVKITEYLEEIKKTGAEANAVTAVTTV